MEEYSIEIKIKSKTSDKTETVIITEKNIPTVGSILELGLRHEEQIQILQKIQDTVLALQSSQLSEQLDECKKCGGQMAKRGYNKSDFHAVFTDHKVKVQRKICKKCGYRSIPSIKSLFGTTSHPDLMKLQCEIGAEHTYRDAQNILNKQSFVERKINNHDQIHNMIERVGGYIGESIAEEKVEPESLAKEIILQVDGGHLKDKSPDKRSFEAMTAVMYRPENICKVSKKKNKITSKHCAASALSDDQEYMKKAVLIAAKKQGISSNTELTALCDGAGNCWNIANSLREHCDKFVGILDWFHIAMKFRNIALPKTQKVRLERIKWCLWHGNVEKALSKMDTLIAKVKNLSRCEKLSKLKTYISNNKEYIVDYDNRQNNKLPFTSHMAESTVESLINQRCKGSQHMRWTRAGVHKLLQIRAIIASNDWAKNWLKNVIGAIGINTKVTI